MFRLRDYYDGAIPSGIAFIIIDLYELYRFTKEEYYMNTIKELVYYFGEDMNKNPLAYLYSIIAVGNFI
ncbi:hypothetical protein [Wansuia hejianensis]|uniref:Uncharacterized protein n=1 Tax=Wansuia hejianensis TaxID=2763667 RepID=A0A926F3K0_9FIRM|nr:hypothetical protein [Wansuia hejianensis]MBC8591307.1 hypothetical protein [Wansuia hejianensis]